jgi:uncharacterized protein
MKGPDFDAAKAYALKRLALELPPQFPYHSLLHTRDEVVPAAMRIAALEGVRGREALLLITAAYYHDLGFTIACDQHEVLSVGIAREQLPGFGYRETDLDTISEIIMATQLPQVPRTRLEMILADADLSVLGSDTFLERNAALREELAFQRGPICDKEWHQHQAAFLNDHRYFTGAARSLYDAKKRENLERVRALLANSENHA